MASVDSHPIKFDDVGTLQANPTSSITSPTAISLLHHPTNAMRAQSLTCGTTSQSGVLVKNHSSERTESLQPFCVVDSFVLESFTCIL